MIWFVVSHSILARWRNHFCQLLNVHGVNDVRQSLIHTAEPLVTEPSAFEFDLSIELLKSHKSPGIDQIPAELVKTVGKTVLCKKGDKTDCSNYRAISLANYIQKFYLTSCCQC